jgi:glycosyltransferase involved in cell wall biosynthesis
MLKKNIHIAHKIIGGVGEILSRMPNSVIQELNLKNLYKAFNLPINEVYFHQPKAHLFAILFKITSILFLKKKKVIIIIHESSNYSNHGNKSIKTQLKYFIRLLNMQLASIIGIKIYAVSNFVANSYKLKIPQISYTHLFRNELIKKQRMNFVDKAGALVWLRPNAADQSINIIRELVKKNLENKFLLVGNAIECIKLEILIKNQFKSAEVLNEKGVVDKNTFLCYLNNYKWLISTYDKEGFGLTVLEALHFGMIILASKEGALSEIVPPENYEIFDKIKNNFTDITTENLKIVSEVNVAKAKFLLNLK